MASSKKTCDKKQRAPRGIQPGDKVVKRGGTGKPQPRRITNAAKVEGTQKNVLKESKFFLPLQGVELLPDIEDHLEFLCGLREASALQDWLKGLVEAGDDELPSVMDIINGQQVLAAQKAFFKACKVVPDSKDAYIGDSNDLAVRGRDFDFFSILEKKDEDEAKAEAERRRNNRNRPQGGHGNRGNRQARGLSNVVSDKLVASGHAAMIEQQKQANRDKLQANAGAPVRTS